MTEQLYPLEQTLSEMWPPTDWRDVTVLVAVSGGPDSVALLRGLQRVSHQKEGRLIAVHFNHGLRGLESDGDQQFVEQLCQRLQVACDVGHAPSERLAPEQGVEEEARRHRYRFLSEASRRWGARYIAMAHNADDQAETILHHIVRGTGLAGLVGIPPTRPLSEMTTLVRPLLFVGHSAIKDYLRGLGQPYRQDSSNKHLGFTRNRIRHQLLPLLRDQFNPRIAPSLVRLGNLAREAQGIIEAAIEPIWQQAVLRRTADRVELARDVLLHPSPFLLRELLVQVWKAQQWPRQEMDERQWSRLSAFIRDESPGAPGRFSLPGPVEVSIEGATVVLQRG